MYPPSSCFVLFHFISFHFVLFCFVFVLFCFCFVLFCFVLFCFVFILFCFYFVFILFCFYFVLFSITSTLVIYRLPRVWCCYIHRQSEYLRYYHLLSSCVFSNCSIAIHSSCLSPSLLPLLLLLLLLLPLRSFASSSAPHASFGLPFRPNLHLFRCGSHF